MPASQSIIWGFPIKGLDIAHSKHDQPQDSTPDCLNVLPYEPVSGRLRGGSRPGSKRSYATAIGGGTTPVNYLGTYTLPLDAGTIVPTNVLLTETFTDTDGVALNSHNSAWTAYYTYQSSYAYDTFNGGVSNSSAYIHSNLARPIQAGLIGAKYTANPSIGAAYSVKITMKATTVGNQAKMGIGVRIGTANGTGIYADFLPCTATVDGQAVNYVNKTMGQVTTIPAGSPQFLETLDHILELRVNGNFFTFYVDGNLLLSFVSSANATNTKVGFYWGGFSITTDADNFIISNGNPVAQYRQTNVIAVSGGIIYEGNQSTLNPISGTTNGLVPGVPVQIAYFGTKGYAVDGTNIVQINMTANLIETYTLIGAGTPPTNCTLACIWNGRLMLAGKRDAPDQFFGSRGLYPNDWNYNTGLSDSAFQYSTYGTVGNVPDAIIAMVPFTDDILVFLCDHTLVMLNGDPGSGGHLDLVSNAIGGLGPNCWTKSPEGVLYFAGTGGFYKIQPGGGAPECISNNTINEIFKSIDRSQTYVTCCWDRDRWGCHIFLTPVTSGAAKHLYFDGRTQSFWYMQYPDDYGPICATVYDGDAAVDRVMMMGGRTGFIYQLDNTLSHDVDTALPTPNPVGITSYVWLGPFIPGDDFHETKIFGLQAYLSDQQGTQVNNMNWTLQTGNDAAQAMGSSPAGFTAATAGAGYVGVYGRRPLLLNRMRGLAFAMKCWNDTMDRRFSFERLLLPIEPGAQIRT